MHSFPYHPLVWLGVLRIGENYSRVRNHMIKNRVPTNTQIPSTSFSTRFKISRWWEALSSCVISYYISQIIPFFVAHWKMNHRNSAVFFSVVSENCCCFTLYHLGMPGTLVSEQWVQQSKEVNCKTKLWNIWSESRAYAATWAQKVVPHGAIWRRYCTLTSCVRSRPREGARRDAPAVVPFQFFVQLFVRVAKVPGMIACNELGDIDYFLPREFVTGVIHTLWSQSHYLLNRNVRGMGIFSVSQSNAELTGSVPRPWFKKEKGRWRHSARARKHATTCCLLLLSY